VSDPPSGRKSVSDTPAYASHTSSTGATNAPAAAAAALSHGSPAAAPLTAVHTTVGAGTPPGSATGVPPQGTKSPPPTPTRSQAAFTDPGSDFPMPVGGGGGHGGLQMSGSLAAEGNAAQQGGFEEGDGDNKVCGPSPVCSLAGGISELGASPTEKPRDVDGKAE
jgi:hypothetical protein